ncbi:MAG: hypothetical protein FJ167_08315, partial [Gammaproteobacteria bacterium]|nr:hypothetical protein [Gammaproteobacteria bacterium]
MFIPCLWTATTGVVDLDVLLIAHGVNLTGLTIEKAGISKDGTVVGGTIVDSLGFRRAFRVSGINFGGPMPPVAPTGVLASDGTSAAHVTVSWAAVTGATGYKVFRGTSESDLQEVGSVGSATTFNDTSVAPATVLMYGVRATNTTGQSPLSSLDSGYRGLSAPTGVLASDGTSATQVAVSWTAAAGATGYEVLRSVGSGTPMLVGVVGAVTTFNDVQSSASTSPQYGVVYNYAVRALSAVGPGVLSAPNAGHLKMAAPTGVLASDGTSTAQVVVSWVAASGATGYQVLRSEGSAAPAQIGTTTGATSYNDTTAVAGKLYSYRVRSTGNPSGNVSESSGSDSGYRGLSAPTGVLASDGTSAAHVAVSWTAAVGATGYEVLRSVGSDTAIVVGSVGAVTTFNDTSADAGVGYQYRVRSMGPTGVNASSPSDVNAGHKRLSPPAVVLASDGTEGTGVVVTWTAAPGATGYRVLRALGTATPSQIGETTGVLTFTDTTAVVGTLYGYRVVAVDTDPAGNVSDPSAADSGYRALPAPTGVLASDGTSAAHVTVSWTVFPGATGYKVFRGTSESSVTTQVGTTSGASATTLNDTTAPVGVTVFYGVRAVTAAGDTPLSSLDNGYRGLSAPTGVLASDGTSATQVAVSWTAAAGAT